MSTRITPNFSIMLKAVIFDFDGVICESVEVKTRAFRKLFKAYPKHLKAIIAYHERNGGLSRYKKFAYIYKHILKMKLAPKDSRRLGKKFSRYSLEAVIKARPVKGAGPFLKKYHKRLKLYVVSGTPQDEMRLIIRRRKMGKFFHAVYGSPETKKQLIVKILKSGKLKRSEAVFVGDSVNDLEGAARAGIPFIGRIHKGPANPFAKNRQVLGIIRDLTELEPLITKLNNT